MRESVIYQEILQEGVQKGLEQGLEQDRQELEQGRQEGRQEGELNLTLRLLSRRFGALAPEVLAAVRGLSVEQLEGLAEVLLDFRDVADLQKCSGKV